MMYKVINNVKIMLQTEIKEIQLILLRKNIFNIKLIQLMNH